MFSDDGPNEDSIEGYQTWRDVIHSMMRPDRQYRAHSFPITPTDSRKPLCDSLDYEISDIEDFVEIFGPKSWAELEYAHNSYNQTVSELNSRRMLSYYFKTLITQLAEFNRFYRSCHPVYDTPVSEDEARRRVRDILINVEVYRAHRYLSRENIARYDECESEDSYSFGLED
jgi:hypothetical protein